MSDDKDTDLDDITWQRIKKAYAKLGACPIKNAKLMDPEECPNADNDNEVDPMAAKLRWLLLDAPR